MMQTNFKLNLSLKVYNFRNLMIIYLLLLRQTKSVKTGYKFKTNYVLHVDDTCKTHENDLDLLTTK